MIKFINSIIIVIFMNLRDILESSNPDKKAFGILLAKGALDVYEGQYICIIDKKVVGNNDKQVELLKQVSEKYGSRTEYYITRVPSPESIAVNMMVCLISKN